MENNFYLCFILMGSYEYGIVQVIAGSSVIQSAVQNWQAISVIFLFFSFFLSQFPICSVIPDLFLYCPSLRCPNVLLIKKNKLCTAHHQVILLNNFSAKKILLYLIFKHPKYCSILGSWISFFLYFLIKKTSIS
jgi:hypothetical protein